MEKIYRDYLYNKQILVSSATADNLPDVKVNVQSLLALLKVASCSISVGADLANEEVCAYVLNKFAFSMDEGAFYRNFPMSIRQMNGTEVLVDQLIHYFTTYGLGEFDEAGHSVFEKEIIKRCEVKECWVKYFTIVTEEEAEKLIKEAFDSLCASTREWNIEQEMFVKAYVYDNYSKSILSDMKSKLNLIHTLLFLKKSGCDDVYNCRSILNINDTYKLVTELINSDNGLYGTDTNNLKLPTSYKKFVSKFISEQLKKINEDNVEEIISSAVEKRKFWKGLLHHIHFNPTTHFEKVFVSNIFDDDVKSDMSMIEELINNGMPARAFSLMMETKGSSFALRNLNYILSRCRPTDVSSVMSSLAKSNPNPFVIMQLMNNYKAKQSSEPRTFSFNVNKVKRKHRETNEEVLHRRSFIPDKIRETVVDGLEKLLVQHYKDVACYNKVYIDAKMEKIALPLENTTSASGLGVLPTGSHVDIPYDTIRLFTYWEKVNDIDFSCMGLDKDFKHVITHNWQTQSNWNQGSTPIVFSGDQTSGFNGGSEFFDIDIPLYRKKYPAVRYLLCSDNVYSSGTFDKYFCIAGFMNRRDLEKGKIYEPKTVASQFQVTAKTSCAPLFIVDLEAREMIWLNVAPESGARVINYNDVEFMSKYVHLIDKFNVSNIYTWLSAERVDTPDEADLIVSDKPEDARDNVEVIHSYDIDKLLEAVNK